jgi:RND superfamily putative drug exporter
MLAYVTHVAIKYRKIIIFVWLVLIVVGFVTGSKLDNSLSATLDVPESGSYFANSILAKNFHENIEGSFIVILDDNPLDQVHMSRTIGLIVSKAQIIPSSHLVAGKVINGMLIVNIGSSLSLLDAANYTDQFRNRLEMAGLSHALVTGPSAIAYDATPVLRLDLHRGEVIGILIALLFLLIIFGRSLASLLPLIFATGTISVTLGVIYIISQSATVVSYIPNVAVLIGLGLALDYSLLLLFRVKHELFKGSTVNESIILTMLSAGKTICISGFIVASALVSLVFVPIPFIASLGVVGATVPLIAIATSLTLFPALLSYLTPTSFKVGRNWQLSLHKRISIMTKRPIIPLCSALFLTALCMIPLLTLQLTPSSLTAIPSNLPSAVGMLKIANLGGVGALTPIEMVIDLGKPKRAKDSNFQKVLTALSTKILSDPEVEFVASGIDPPFVDSTGQYLRLIVISRHALGSRESVALTQRLRSTYWSDSGFSLGSTMYLGGAPAQGLDLINSIESSVPITVITALIICYVILAWFFRSIFLPLKSILLALISVCVSMAAVSTVFSAHGIMEHFGVYHPGAIEIWALLFLGAILFGVSMDYEIFIISRIAELRKAGYSKEDSITLGLTQSAPIITPSAIIFIAAASGLVFSHFVGLQELGIGLTCGIIFDATIIRGVLLPSIMVLLGDWNWWWPLKKSRHHRLTVISK